MNEFKPIGITLTGKVRHKNEDSFLCTNVPGRLNNLAIIADGIGGNARGELASRLCCEFFYEEWESQEAYKMLTIDNMQKFMLKTLIKVNHRIFQMNKNLALERPMGTTIVAVAIMPAALIVVYAGDSRFYEFNEFNGMMLHTVDHTLSAQLKHMKFVGSDDEIPVAYNNIITLAVGIAAKIPLHNPKAPVLKTILRNPQSRYILCTDGLSHLVRDEVIQQIVDGSSTNEEAINKLVAAAFIAGADDNLTMIIF